MTGGRHSSRGLDLRSGRYFAFRGLSAKLRLVDEVGVLGDRLDLVAVGGAGLEQLLDRDRGGEVGELRSLRRRHARAQAQGQGAGTVSPAPTGSSFLSS